MGLVLTVTLPPPPDLQRRVLFPARAPSRNAKERGGKQRRSLILAGNAARGEPVAHRGVFGRRGCTPFGEFLALFRQQFH
jgi:hypothetical protein